MAAERTWEISDIDGTNKRTVTLAQYRAELDAAKVRAMAIYNAECAELARTRRSRTAGTGDL